MCDATAIVTSAVAIGSTIVGSNEQKKLDNKNKKNAGAALQMNNRDISMRALQERIAIAQEREQLNAQAAEVTGLTKVSAAAGGVGGMTVDMLLQDVNNRRLGAQDSLTQQVDATLAGLDRERSGALVSSRNQANMTAGPNPWAAGIRIGGSLADSYAGYLSRKPPVSAGR